jgi:hypothetical protein
MLGAIGGKQSRSPVIPCFHSPDKPSPTNHDFIGCIYALAVNLNLIEFILNPTHQVPLPADVDTVFADGQLTLGLNPFSHLRPLMVGKRRDATLA